MTKLEKIWWVCVTVSALGIISFWVAGLNDHDAGARYSIIVSGVTGWIGVIALGLHKLRSRHGF